MSCIERYASAQDFADFWCLEAPCDEEKLMIERFLDLAAADIHAALAASGACDCSLASWALEYLKKLNIIEAAIIHNCPCKSANLSAEMKATWLEWINGQFEGIRKQVIELCDGETGADFPVVGWAQQGWNEFARTRIVLNDMLRNS